MAAHEHALIATYWLMVGYIMGWGGNAQSAPWWLCLLIAPVVYLIEGWVWSLK